jgi:hypothetical protein
MSGNLLSAAWMRDKPNHFLGSLKAGPQAEGSLLAPDLQHAFASEIDIPENLTTKTGNVGSQVPVCRDQAKALQQFKGRVRGIRGDDLRSS